MRNTTVKFTRRASRKNGSQSGGASLAGLLMLGLYLTAGTGCAQNVNSENTLTLDGAVPPKASIEELAWLTGYWRGSGLGGQCEEMWGEPFAGRMLGSFALMRDGELVFSEAMSLVEENGSLVLKIRHFDPGFIAWEEKDDYVRFPLVKTGDNVAWFNGLTFRKSGPNKLQIFLVLHDEGKKEEHIFEFERVRPQ